MLTKTNRDMKVVREEIFGQVVCVQSFDDDNLDQVAKFANDTEYGLQATRTIGAIRPGRSTASGRPVGAARWQGSDGALDRDEVGGDQLGLRTGSVAGAGLSGFAPGVWNLPTRLGVFFLGQQPRRISHGRRPRNIDPHRRRQSARHRRLQQRRRPIGLSSRPHDRQANRPGGLRDHVVWRIPRDWKQLSSRSPGRSFDTTQTSAATSLKSTRACSRARLPIQSAPSRPGAIPNMRAGSTIITASAHTGASRRPFDAFPSGAPLGHSRLMAKQGGGLTSPPCSFPVSGGEQPRLCAACCVSIPLRLAAS